MHYSILSVISHQPLSQFSLTAPAPLQINSLLPNISFLSHLSAIPSHARLKFVL